MDETKLAPKLLAELQKPRPQDAEAEPIPVIIRYKPDVIRSQAVKEGIEAHFVYKLTPTVAAAAPGHDIADLTDEGDIDYIWLDEEVHTCLDRSVQQIGVPPIWAAGYTGAGIKVAVVDTGIDPDHPDFSGRIVAGASFVGDDYRDGNGHGTHVAGTVAGSGAAQDSKYKGVAPGALLYIAQSLDRHGGGSMSTVMAGIEWVVEQGVQVINMSLGGAGPSDGQDALSLTCNAAVERGIVVCVAAGNAGPGGETVGAPGAAADVITIGAVDRQDGIARFSSRGPTADGRRKPDVCLPGTDIVSARAAGTSMGTPLDTLYTAASGTSMATPHAAGLAALLLQANPSLQPAEIKQVLMDTALNLGQDPNAQGAGRVQAEHAFRAILGEEPPVTEPTPTPPIDETPGDGEETPTKKGCLPTFLISLIGQ